MKLRRIVLILSLAMAAVATAAPALAQTSAVNRPAEVRRGTCGDLGDVVAPLANLVFTMGDPQGQLDATPVEQSGTVVQFTIADFLAANHAVVVQESPQAAQIVACGEVGGSLNPDGTLAVGMRGMNGSGLSGIAYFTPIDAVQTTLVTVLLVSEGGGTTIVEEVTTDDVPAPAPA